MEPCQFGMAVATLAYQGFQASEHRLSVLVGALLPWAARRAGRLGQPWRQLLFIGSAKYEPMLGKRPLHNRPGAFHHVSTDVAFAAAHHVEDCRQAQGVFPRTPRCFGNVRELNIGPLLQVELQLITAAIAESSARPKLPKLSGVAIS